VRKLVDAAPPDDCAESCDKGSEACDKGCGDRGCMLICEQARVQCKVGCDLGLGPDARARMAAWLRGPLLGNDNGMARMRAASISSKGSYEYDEDVDVYAAHIDNQFGFTCGLEWGPDGSPAKLKDCKATTAGYRATPAEIKLSCRVEKKRETCTGAYRLQAGHLDDAAVITLQRPKETGTP